MHSYLEKITVMIVYSIILFSTLVLVATHHHTGGLEAGGVHNMGAVCSRCLTPCWRTGGRSKCKGHSNGKYSSP